MPTNVLTGSADEDSAQKTDPSQNQSKSDSTGGAPTGTSDQKPVTGPTGPSSNRNYGDNTSPGRRLKNPLGDYPSYTYQISLYMVTPEAYDKFIQQQRLAIANIPGVVLVAQSGGINNTTSKRAAGFELDVYIDNLVIKQVTNGKDSQSAANISEMSFNIVEPYGFSFITNLKRAANDIIAQSRVNGIQTLSNPTRQFFVLGVKFVGFDLNGQPLTAKDDISGGGENGIFERFFDIMIKKMSFRLDGKATVYKVEAATLSPGVAFGSKKGVWEKGGEIDASTVGQALQIMMDKINNEERRQANESKRIPNKYAIDFVGPGSDVIKAAKMVVPSDIDKHRWSGNDSKTTKDSNDAKGTKTPPNKESKVIQIETGVPITQAIETIISRSTYIIDALKIVHDASTEPDPKDPSKSTTLPDAQKTVAWYHLSAECSNAQFDETINDFAWNIKYIIERYDTPVITNAYTNLGIPYYGPHKRYNYYFTGKNSEVLSYDQNLDNAFFNIALIAPEEEEGKPSGAKTPAQVPLRDGRKQPQPNTGELNLGAQAQNAYLTDLYDPGAYANASIKIMGDPDFLMPDQTSSVESVYNKFYGADGFTINANGGQVFIEVDFKEAVDFNYKRNSEGSFFSTETGLLELNESIRFWKYPAKIEKVVKGVSYMVLNVTHVFNNGKFEQTLQCTINTFPGVEDDEGAGEGQAAGTSTESAGREQAAQTTNDNIAAKGAKVTGLLEVPEERFYTPPPLIVQTPEYNFGGSPTVNTETGPDDDKNGYTAGEEYQNYASQFGDPGTQDIPPDDQRVEFDGTNWYDANGNIIPPPGG